MVIKRRGKWTKYESKYAESIIEAFEIGLLPLPTGVTLRLLLSKILECDPMRISKKFVGDKSVGKQIFISRTNENVSISDIEESRRKIIELEDIFIMSLKNKKLKGLINENHPDFLYIDKLSTEKSLFKHWNDQENISLEPLLDHPVVNSLPIQDIVKVGVNNDGIQHSLKIRSGKKKRKLNDFLNIDNNFNNNNNNNNDPTILIYDSSMYDNPNILESSLDNDDYIIGKGILYNNNLQNNFIDDDDNDSDEIIINNEKISKSTSLGDISKIDSSDNLKAEEHAILGLGALSSTKNIEIMSNIEETMNKKFQLPFHNQNKTMSFNSLNDFNNKNNNTKKFQNSLKNNHQYSKIFSKNVTGNSMADLQSLVEKNIIPRVDSEDLSSPFRYQNNIYLKKKKIIIKKRKILYE